MGGYWLSRLVFQRALALVFLIAFLCAVNQFRPLLGERGLLPVPAFVQRVTFRQAPSLFHFWPHDGAFLTAAWLGVILSVAALTGFSDRYWTWLSMLVWGSMWVLYLSFVNVGQVFYGFGWESILLEAGFFAMLLGPAGVEPPRVTNWMLRWLCFRVMFGAGLIKLRGDPCWHDWTCLDYHYETQPMPNPLSWYFHWAPAWTHKAGVGFNHFAELIVPFGYFAPQPIATIAGIITILFQGLIFASGNLSWLNFMTMVLAIPMLDDRLLGAIIPVRPETLRPSGIVFRGIVYGVALLVAVLSIDPIRNMISSGQVMNTTFNNLHLVGTYGAFGSVTRERNEIIIEGTDEFVIGPSTKWRAYEFKGKPGDPSRSPPQIAPYHLRLDWLMWFAAMSDYYQHPWFIHLLGKLLQGDADTLSLLAYNPFPGEPPRYIRAELYQYHFATPADRKQNGHWWTRQRVAEYFPPVSLQTPQFRAILERQGWL
ncbi:MAG TPA: lipase maturation factor family protein [Bryobacteraceae bacterium]|jgi:hypothetical protein